MTQFDVFDNPIPKARRLLPYVAVLQADSADTGRERIVAPLVARTRMAVVVGRLMPVVKIGTAEHVLLVPGLSSVDAADLREARGHIGKHRSEIVAALDYLFLGV